MIKLTSEDILRFVAWEFFHSKVWPHRRKLPAMAMKESIDELKKLGWLIDMSCGKVTWLQLYMPHQMQFWIENESAVEGLNMWLKYNFHGIEKYKRNPAPAELHAEFAAYQWTTKSRHMVAALAHSERGDLE